MRIQPAGSGPTRRNGSTTSATTAGQQGAADLHELAGEFLHPGRPEATDGKALVLKAVRTATGAIRPPASRPTEIRDRLRSHRGPLKLPRGRDLAAFWMLSDNIDQSIGRLRRNRYRRAHRHQPARCMHAARARLLGPARPDQVHGAAQRREFQRGYHVFAVDWQPGKIEWLLDGQVYHTLTPASLPAGPSGLRRRPPFSPAQPRRRRRLAGYPDATTHSRRNTASTTSGLWTLRDLKLET